MQRRISGRDARQDHCHIATCMVPVITNNTILRATISLCKSIIYIDKIFIQVFCDQICGRQSRASLKLSSELGTVAMSQAIDPTRMDSR